MKKILLTFGAVLTLSLAGTSLIQADSNQVAMESSVTMSGDCTTQAQTAAEEAYASAGGDGSPYALMMARAAYMTTMAECLSMASGNF